MADRLGYVIVTHLPMREPVVECEDIIGDLDDAFEQRDQMAKDWAAAGRPGRYTVAELTDLEDQRNA